MTPDTNKLLETVAAWPVEDQQELAEAAREIEARRTGIYPLSGEERSEAAAGLAEADRGEFISDEDMAAHWKRWTR